MFRFLSLLFAIGLGLPFLPVRASDHADPALPSVLNPSLAKEPNITDLYFFPKGDRYVVIFDVFRSLTAAPPYKLKDYEFNVYMDLHSKIDFSDPAIRARYGGKIVDPKGIRPDVTIKINLDENAKLVVKDVKGLKNTDAIIWYSGLRDDPFIFPPFFAKNVIAMVISIPKSAFPQGQQNWILWADTRKKGSDEILDHVGRALRTQLPRFGFINKLPPWQHVEAIHAKAHKRNDIRKFLMEYLAPTTNVYDLNFVIRKYDEEPDVAIYSSQFPVLFPNGRNLEDDVAKIACDFGDCVLVELANSNSRKFPRQTVNDKPFQADFPYLAEPWPSKRQPPPVAGLTPQWQIRIFLVLATALGLLIPYALISGLRAKFLLRQQGRK